MVTFQRVENPQDFQTVEELADVIWHEHYNPLIGENQVRYMLRKFQQKDIIRRQIEEEGYHYFLMMIDGAAHGYMALQPHEEQKKLFLSKLYLHASQRRRGVAKKAMDWVSRFARERELSSIFLYVHKQNSSLEFYHRNGFVKVEPVITEIGNGYVMEDWLLELSL